MFTLVVAGAVIAVGVLMLAALVEFHRQIDQLRQYVGIAGDAQALDINLSADLHDFNLPAPELLSGRERAAMLIVSDHCLTCLDIIDHLSEGEIPDGLVVLVEAETRLAALGWIDQHGLTIGPSIVYDDHGLARGALGIDVTPAAVRFQEGSVIGAMTVPSGSSLGALLDWLDETTHSRHAWASL